MVPLYFKTTNQFLVPSHKTIPFKAKIWNHPVDFCYPRSFGYGQKINLPKGHRVRELPKVVALGLPVQSGLHRLNCNQGVEAVPLPFPFQIKDPQDTDVGHPFGKEILGTAVNLQNKNYIVFERE